MPPPNLNLEHHIVVDGLMSCILLTSLKVSELLLLVLIVLSVLLQGGGHGHMSQDGGGGGGGRGFNQPISNCLITFISYHVYVSSTSLVWPGLWW